MEELFNLPVMYKGEELEFPARLVIYGFTSRFIVLVSDVEVIFERDDAGDFRAILPNAKQFIGELPLPALLEAIQQSIIAIAS